MTQITITTTIPPDIPTGQVEIRREAHTADAQEGEGDPTRETQLDHGLAETFPASDPVSIDSDPD